MVMVGVWGDVVERGGEEGKGGGFGVDEGRARLKEMVRGVAEKGGGRRGEKVFEVEKGKGRGRPAVLPDGVVMGLGWRVYRADGTGWWVDEGAVEWL